MGQRSGRAPRRTVAVVAAAVAGTLLPAAARSTPSVAHARAQPPDAQSAAEDPGDSAQLLESFRAMRRAQCLRKKQRRHKAKQAAQISQRLAPSETQHVVDVSSEAGAAGQCAELQGVPVAVPALAP